MKILHDCVAGYLGYYASLEALLSDYPEGGEPGSFFLNGETSTLWMWNPLSHSWCNSNYATAPEFVGVIFTPSTFSPSVFPTHEALYYYVAASAGSYSFPSLKELTQPIVVTCSKPSIVLLHWDGAQWTPYVYPLEFSPLTVHCYRGKWNSAKSYKRTADCIDVVWYNGGYYRLLTDGTETGTTPDTASVWEPMPDYTALAGGLQVIEKNGNGVLSLSPDTATLSIMNAQGNEVLHVALMNGGDYVRQTFTRIEGDVAYRTIITPDGITIAEGTAGSLGSIISKKYTINASGVSSGLI